MYIQKKKKREKATKVCVCVCVCVCVFVRARARVNTNERAHIPHFCHAQTKTVSESDLTEKLLLRGGWVGVKQKVLLRRLLYVRQAAPFAPVNDAVLQLASLSVHSGERDLWTAPRKQVGAVD